MTSDAKIGLLLGLAFIFIIAFIINGLPGPRDDSNNNKLTTDMLDFPNNPPGLAAKERKVHREIITYIEPIRKQPVNKTEHRPTNHQDIRFTMPLPKNTAAIKEAEKTIKIQPPTVISPSPIDKKSDVKKAKSTKTGLPKIYTVKEGDNLASIAKKFYGDQQGNKIANIIRIFQANRKILKSPDEIYAGQKIIIPPLTPLKSDKSKVTNIFSSANFTNVESIGKRHLSDENQATKQYRWYIVQEGDSLWQIAAICLGDGSRYTEIARLNADILEDENHLKIGMRLKIPVQ